MNYDVNYSKALRYTAEEVEQPSEPEEHSAECPNCGATHPLEDLITTSEGDGETGCPSCTQTCERCDNREFTDDFQRIGTTSRRYGYRPMRCGPCVQNDYSPCGDCGELFTEGDLNNSNASDESICERCGENYFHCDSCNNTFGMDDYGEEGFCQNCTEPEQQESDDIHPPRYSPDDLEFHGEGRHYGVELETVLKEGDLQKATQETLKKLNKGLPDEGFAYLKEDGSLGGGVGSFEIVTHPATLDVHKERWGAFLQPNSPKGLLSHDTDCCGLHIHVERKDLSDLTVGKILSFVNAASNADFITAVAGRPSNRYSSLNPDKKPQDATKKNRSRYEAVNLQNDHTIEFRIFKGTLKPEAFFRNLEFVDAVVEFAKPSTSSLKSMIGTDSFFNFVASNHKKYPNLLKFCEKFTNKELVKKSKPKPEKNSRIKDQSPVNMSVRLLYSPR